MLEEIVRHFEAKVKEKKEAEWVEAVEEIFFLRGSRA